MIRFFPRLGPVLAFLFVFNTISAQISDNFSDGNFTDNPSWQGSTANFIVNAAGELQLNAPDGGSSTLAVQGNIPDSAIWTMHIRMAFAPSTQNLLRIYLQADQADLLSSKGYYLEIGETGSADALRLFRQDGGSATLLGTGTAGLVGTDPVDIQIRMKRSVTGLWALEAGPNGAGLSAQFTAGDAVYKGGNNRFFGFYCLYSATRKNLFYFDDIQIVPDLPDVQAPQLISATAANANEVLLVFNEKLSATSANNTSNYGINKGIGTPSNAVLQTDGKSVVLQMPSPLTTGTYTCTVNGVQDLAGNTADNLSAVFDYVDIGTVGEFDVIINEIMFDPKPSVGLPEVEWIEIYNRSSKILALNTLKIDDGGSSQSLPAYNLQPNAYVILTSTTGFASLSALYPNTLGVAGFPTLNDTGDEITLSANAGVIDRVSYSPNWHDDGDKKNGGWSLERINPGTPCLGGENWRSCLVLPGGTPGTPNASLRTDPDLNPPVLVAAFPESSTLLSLEFSEGLDKTTAAVASSYLLSPARTVLSATLDPGNRRKVNLQLAEALEAGIVYQLTVNQYVTDCSNNPVGIKQDPIRVGLPQKPERGDVLANEVLCNPLPYGSRFVEFVNGSNKIISLEKCYLANFNNGADVQPLQLRRLFFPGEFLVFTSNPSDIASKFDSINSNQLILLSGPSYSDDADNLTFYWTDNGQTVILDSLNYSDDWHNALLSVGDREGVSLERIRLDQPTNSSNNWTSASPLRTRGSGTPTLPNSQQRNQLAALPNLISLPNPRLSPDGDGYEDFLEIFYTIPDAGYAATVTVYDSDGAVVKHLSRQDLIGTSGALRWDGDSDEGSKVRPGIYILFFEIFHPDGTVRHQKATVSVVKRF